MAQQITIPAGSFQKQLQHLINCNSIELRSNTADDVLANYLIHCLAAFQVAVEERGVPTINTTAGGK